MAGLADAPVGAAGYGRAPLALWRLARMALHAAHGLLVVWLRFPSLDAAARQQRIAWWSGKLMRLLGVRYSSSGGWHAGAKLVVANHISWLDIAAIHAVCPQARFVAKADIRSWPIVGLLTASADTLFIEREKKRDAMRVVHHMAEALRNGDTVAVFPEGTTGDGRELLPFHANLLQAAIAAERPVQPAALRFSDARHAISPAAEFVGDTTLVQSLWRVASAEGLAVHVTVLPPQASAHADRRALAAHLRDCLAQALETRH